LHLSNLLIENELIVKKNAVRTLAAMRHSSNLPKLFRAEVMQEIAVLNMLESTKSEDNEEKFKVYEGDLT
jgi:vesicle coat complex subunit